MLFNPGLGDLVQPRVGSALVPLNRIEPVLVDLVHQLGTHSSHSRVEPAFVELVWSRIESAVQVKGDVPLGQTTVSLQCV